MLITTENEDYKELFETILKKTIENLNQPAELEVGINLISTEEMREINKTSRGIDSATDVLSFPVINLIAGQKIVLKDYKNDIDFESGLLNLGDIVICDKISAEQAAEFGHSLERETAYLFTHGLLHLFGYDHTDEECKRIMRQKEEEILKELKIER